MQDDRTREESLLFQWNFFERAVSNYSIIIKMFQQMEGERDLVSHMPRIFVEETLFDACEIIMRDGGEAGFFSVDEKLRPLNCDEVERPKGVLYSPSVLSDSFGYGTLYIYPLKRGIHVFGYLMLGRKNAAVLEEATLRDIDLLSEIVNRFVLLSMQVNELKAAETEKVRQLDARLATKRTLLESVINQFPHPLLMIDRNGTICFANRRARDEFFEGKDFSMGEPIENVVQGIERGFLDKDLILQGELHCKKGSDHRLYNVESYPIKDDSGKIVFKSLLLKDVIDQKMEEEENINKNRMESIGKLAGGIAHDFNNVLTGILGYASLMKRQTENGQSLNRYAEVIESSAKRAASLTEHLLNFSRRQRTEKVDLVDLNALLGDVLFLVRESFRTVQITAELDSSLPSVIGNGGELQHALLNLCVNAKDAMPQGGRLLAKTEKKSYLGGREFSVVTIADTGCGMDENLRNRVFEPYFTTKTDKKKLGMGLYLVQKVVRDHRGFIELQTDKEKGTRFTLYFPVADSRKEQAKPAVSPRGWDGGKKRVLVVDDEEVVRGFLSGVLSTEGFEVLLARDGMEAVRIFSEQERIDLVLLDMIMPGIKGEEVLKQLREHSPEVKVVVSSGFMTEEQREKLQEYRVDGYLDKPYGDADAVNMVRSALNGGHAAAAE